MTGNFSRLAVDCFPLEIWHLMVFKSGDFVTIQIK